MNGELPNLARVIRGVVFLADEVAELPKVNRKAEPAHSRDVVGSLSTSRIKTFFAVT